MDNRFVTNVAFALLIIFLFISAMKGTHINLSPSEMFNFADKAQKTESVNPEPVVVNEFESMPRPKKVEQHIDKATALSYAKTRALSGTEMLALTKVKKISEHLNKNKKIVIYVTKGSDRDIQAFIKEFSKTRTRLGSNSNYVFIPLETLWDLNQDDSTVKNSHDRVIYNLKRDCGLFCVLDTGAEQMLRLKGSNVNKKSAEIIDVILKN